MTKQTLLLLHIHKQKVSLVFEEKNSFLELFSKEFTHGVVERTFSVATTEKMKSNAVLFRN